MQRNLAGKPIVVAIGIQARSTSKRFPGKVHKLIDKKTAIQHVISAANNAASYMNNWNSKNLRVEVCLLIPEKDELLASLKGKVNILEADSNEHDVLSRYVLLQKTYTADYIVRITGDCPLLPPFIISKLINIATINKYDYLSNVDERCRTAVDGHDVEVISKKLLAYMDKEVTSPSAREHVTISARLEPPPWADIGTVINFLDLSHMKLSLDTAEDLVAIRQAYLRVENAYEKAVILFGKNAVHRL